MDLTTIPQESSMVAVSLTEEDWRLVSYVLLHSAVIPLVPATNYARIEALAASVEQQCDDATPTNTQASPRQLRERLVAARKARHLSQTDLADTFGVTYCTVSRWERGVATPTRFHRHKLAKMFGMSEQELGFV
jgi:DNA-binding transcriptional regulator YiaG